MTDDIRSLVPMSGGSSDPVSPPPRVGTPLVCVVSGTLVRLFSPSTFREIAGRSLDLPVVMGPTEVFGRIARAAYVSDEAIAVGLSNCVALIDPYSGKLRERCPFNGRWTIWGLLPLPQGVATGRAAAYDPRLIVGRSTGQTHVWQPSRGAKKGGLVKLGPRERYCVYSLAFCPEWDNRVFIAGSGSRSVTSISLERPEASLKNLGNHSRMNNWGLSSAADVGMLFTAQTNGSRMAWCRDSETWIKYPEWEYGCTAMYYAKDKHYNLIGSYANKAHLRRVGVFDTRKPEQPAFEFTVSRDVEGPNSVREIARLTEDVFVSVGENSVGFWSIAGRGKLLHEHTLPGDAQSYGVCSIGCDYNHPFGIREDGETPEEVNARLAFLLEKMEDRCLSWEVRVGSALLRAFASFK